ncbi:DNA (cytosine-5)-methyltransferase 3 [Capsicum baccatum]|uniref:DNA (Cytosine-5)-methyltransferase 3 n=1 Tax=Capsicum baccatum TaxID=33114 RepID=A0A2G2VU00_CAPBA|nr:DNA (cytosine-5)-methyltransferase 3 [Capsicum baccatum]
MKAFGGLKLVTVLVLGISVFLIVGVECEDDDTSVMLVLKKSLNPSQKTGVLGNVLYDHRSLQLNDDDHQRVCQIPKWKGLDWSSDKKVEWDPDVERVLLPSGKPLVPKYAIRFVGGSSSKPFGHLWWDETVPTVVTRVELHKQASFYIFHRIQSIELACIILKPCLLFLYSFQTIIHPLQDRVLTIRENARLQGFPYYYKLIGPIKESMAVNGLIFMVAVGFNAAARIYPGLWSAMFMGERLQEVDRPVSKAQK